MESPVAARAQLRPAWQVALGGLTWRRAVVAGLLALLAASALTPLFVIPFGVLLARMMFIAALLLVVSRARRPGPGGAARLRARAQHAGEGGARRAPEAAARADRAAFLFNTLANVQALVESGSPQAAPVLKSLIAYLRAAVPKLHAEASTLGNEIALVRAYLELMRMRMPDRLSFSIDVPDELANVEFLPMSALTLVENAVRHGVDPSESGGRIDVAAKREPGGGEIRVVVADSGAGMSESAVPGTGLANLESRLRGFFGATARRELHDARPHGLSAEIVFVPGMRGTA